MKIWDSSGDGRFWKVQLDVRDLGRHLDFTNRARAGTFSCRVKEATARVATVGALPLGFQVKLGLVRGKYILAGLHAAEASYVSSSSLIAFTPAVLNLLDGPVGVDLALHVVWFRFRMMRRYLAYCPEEEPKIFRMLHLISRRAPGHAPVHLLLISAAELVLHGMEMRMALLPQGDDWSISERKGFLGAEFADVEGSLQLLISSHLRERDKMLLRVCM